MISPDSVKGFLHPEEGEALAGLAREAVRLGPVLEIGSYCGKSALYLGPAVREGGVSSTPSITIAAPRSISRASNITTRISSTPS